MFVVCGTFNIVILKKINFTLRYLVVTTLSSLPHILFFNSTLYSMGGFIYLFICHKYFKMTLIPTLFTIGT